jgi:hypothetical protein
MDPARTHETSDAGPADCAAPRAPSSQPDPMIDPSDSSVRHRRPTCLLSRPPSSLFAAGTRCLSVAVVMRSRPLICPAGADRTEAGPLGQLPDRPGAKSEPLQEPEPTVTRRAIARACRAVTGRVGAGRLLARLGGGPVAAGALTPSRGPRPEGPAATPPLARITATVPRRAPAACGVARKPTQAHDFGAILTGPLRNPPGFRTRPREGAPF